MKTKEEIEAINRKRKQALALLADAARIMGETGCSLGKDTINEAIKQLKAYGADEY